MLKTPHLPKRTINVMASALLVAAVLCVAPAVAYGSELDDVRSEIQDKVAQLDELTEKADQADARIIELDEHIEELSGEIKEKEEILSNLRTTSGSMARTIYKHSDDLSFITILVNSESLSEVSKRMVMREKVLSEFMGKLEEQKNAREELEEARTQAEADKEEQGRLLVELEEEREALNSSIEELKSREEALDYQQRVAVALAAAAAHEIPVPFDTVEDDSALRPASVSSDTSEEEEADSDEEASSDEKKSDASDDSDVSGSSKKSAEAEEPEEAEETEESEEAEEPAEAEEPSAPSGVGEWQTGGASAYGGETDKYVKNPCPTATGDVCDDWSVGVAVPLSWGPGQYYGKYVEVSYNGKSIIAPVNDCGGMDGHDLILDLQPGVWKAFGAESCDDWGVREVRFRFIDG